MSTNRTAIRFLFFSVVLALPLSAFATTYDVKALIDTDNNRATGCPALAGGTLVTGIDTILTTSVTVTGTTATVTGVTRQTCNPGSGLFGAGVPVDSGWNVGVSSSGDLLVESHLGPTILTWDNVGTPRFVFTASSGSLSDVLLTPFSTGGGDIVMPHAARDRAVLAHALRSIHLDGDGSDWAGNVPLANGSEGSSSLRFISVQAYAGPNDFFFNFQIHTNPASPTAVDDAYDLATLGGTLTVSTLGVLNNDSDPNGLPLTAILVDNPQHGTLTLNANGGFTYIHDGSCASQDQFRYKASNGSLDSNTATVTISLPGGGNGNGNSYTFTSPNHVTFTAGVANTFTVTVTGHPTPALTEDGALPAGITFVDNGNGTGTLSGTPGANTGGTYPITFHAEKNNPHQADQLFTLTIGQAPVITSITATTFTVGTAGSFTVTASGFPAPTIAESGALPSGVTFNAGTATLSGTPAAGTGGQYNITFTASNGFSPNATQPFVLIINEAPSFTSANAVTFQTGVAGTFTVTTLGLPETGHHEERSAPEPASRSPTTATARPPWPERPNAGTGGTYPLTLTAANGVGAERHAELHADGQPAAGDHEREQRDVHHRRGRLVHGDGHRLPGADGQRDRRAAERSDIQRRDKAERHARAGKRRDLHHQLHGLERHRPAGEPELHADGQPGASHHERQHGQLPAGSAVDLHGDHDRLPHSRYHRDRRASHGHHAPRQRQRYGHPRRHSSARERRQLLDRPARGQRRGNGEPELHDHRLQHDRGHQSGHLERTGRIGVQPDVHADGCGRYAGLHAQ